MGTDPVRYPTGIALPIRADSHAHRCRCVRIASPHDQCAGWVYDPDDPVCQDCRLDHWDSSEWSLA